MTEFWERYGFLLTQGLIVLLLSKVYGLSDTITFTVSGAFVALLYMTSFLGGYLADKVLGTFHTAVLGGWILCLGYLGLGFGYHFGPETAFISLAVIAVGPGMIKSNTATLLGNAYPVGDTRRDYGFSIRSKTEHHG